MRRRAGDPTDSDQRRQGHGRVRARHLAAVGPANGARIAGKKVLASTCSLSPFALPLLSPEPICCPRPPATGLSNSLISETAISSAGRRSSARCSRDCWTYPVITCGIAGADTRRLEIVHQVVSIHNRAAGSVVPGDELVGTEFLQLVCFGLPAPMTPDLRFDPCRRCVAQHRPAVEFGIIRSQSRSPMQSERMRPRLPHLEQDNRCC
jgi:hypothetical protein